MGALIQAFFRILLLRAGPQTIPPSSVLMWLVLLLHLVMNFLLVIFSQPLGYSLLSSLVGTLLLVAVVHGLLLLFGRQPRYLQTITALAGCEVLLGLMLLPLPIVEFYYGESVGAELRALMVFTLLTVTGWSVVLTAHILKHALSVSTALGFLYSISYFIVAFSVGYMMSLAGAT